ncbi:hypothetical protein [Deinococcus koreensis]|uniref:Uncharacterized protein n=1 Tax=Deinococcus koreensis TaxID=2054903 RepID=A0A2K3UX76_9DEIO|nr:hypothetical protein [Deinococcus koreensis]PNY81143.1 hypothetical protein CVO96_06905 [Deinococcus koreensis]
MRAAFSLSFFLFLGALATAAQSGGTSAPPLNPGWQSRLAALLPATGQTASVMRRQPNLTILDLTRRVMYVQGNREALNKVLSDYQSGVQPTYDERLGITREEFKRYLVIEEELVSSGRTVRLPVTRETSRLTFGDAPGLDGVLKGVSIDLRTGEMRVPEGYAARPIAVAPNTAEDGRLPVRSGFQWKIKGSDSKIGNGVNGTMNLLQLTDDQIILSYKRTSMIARKLSEGEIILSYER